MTDPTAAPALMAGLPNASRDRVLVTGGTGRLGRAVVAELIRSAVPVRVLTRRSAVDLDTELAQGDLATGEGLADAIDGVGCVIHLASDPHHGQQVDVEGTRRLTDALRDHDGARLLHMSIVGCWDCPLPYYRIKSAAETVVVDSGVPHSVVRATQFHPLVERLLTPRAGLTTAPAGVRLAPVDPDWVARRLVDLALAVGEQPGLIQLAGPEVLSARDAAVLTAHARGLKLRRHVPVPAVGAIARALARGSNLPGPDAERGGSTYAEWLGSHPATTG